jgi:hypothetical protein
MAGMPLWIWAEASLIPAEVIIVVVFIWVMRRLGTKRGI